MKKIEKVRYDEEELEIIDSMFPNCDSEDEIQEAIEDFMNSYD